MTENDPDLSAALDLPGTRLIRARREHGRVRIIIETDAAVPPARSRIEAEIRARMARITTDPVQIALIGARSDTGQTGQPRRRIAIASGKGGVGKSTVSANLAVALTRLGRRVGMIDADIHGPSQPRLLQAEALRPAAAPATEGGTARLAPTITPSGVGLLSVGQMVAPGKALAWRGAMAGSALGQLLGGAWDGFDPVLIDLPPGTGDVQLSMLRNHKPDGAIIVSTPQDLALIDARRAIDLFEQTGVPLIGLVENMAGYVCPHCGEASDPFGIGGVEAEAAALNVPLIARIPLHAAIRLASDAGTPPAMSNGAEATAFLDLARTVDAWLDCKLH